MDDLLNNAPCGFLAFADDGTIAMVNATLRDLLEYKPGDLENRPLGMILPAGARVFYQTHFFPLLKLHGRADEIYLTLRSRSGEERPMLVNAVRRERGGVAVNDCILMPMRQRSRYEDEILQARKAAERLQQHQQRIATALQDALQPPVPENIPHLRIAPFMKPALDEAAVGGDFFDVFALDKDLYALVIADVSGKGLAAAAQLATVRNSLRTTLYLYRGPASAVTSLNNILTVHDQLSGFVTAFVGVYDGSTGLVTYASCGHEPALIHRAATGEVETTRTTGPPLGAAENALYGEQEVTLSAGDRLLLYTDGLSEAGPSRREMLGQEGLIRLFTQLPADEDVHTAAAEIVRQANAYANGAFHDDVCVLLARRH